MIKPYEHNKQLSRDFIQGYYMPDHIISQLLSESKQLHAAGKSIHKGKPYNYHGIQLEQFSNTCKENFLGCLNDIVMQYEKNYFYLGILNYKLLNCINVQYWEPNNFYTDFHSELSNRFNEVLRSLVFMTYLNDIEEGGETDFFYQNVKIKPKKGLTIIWPANWTHMHRGSKTSESKHAVTGWFELIPEERPDSEIYYNIPERKRYKSEYT